MPSVDRPNPFRRKTAATRPGEPAFSAFLERDATRQKRRRSRRNTIVVSVLIHAVAVAVVVILSFWHVEELWSPSVQVRVFPRSAAPPAAVRAVFPESPEPKP